MVRIKDKSLYLSLTLLFILSFVFLYPALRISIPKGGYKQYAIVFFPNVTHLDSFKRILAAGGLPVRDGVFGFIMIAASNDPQFLEKIKSQGVVTVFRPLIEGGCFIESKTIF